MIVDCFIFYNEIKMLKFRLEELYEHVDYFIIVESKKTFVGKEKPSFFEMNKQLFQKYEDKIILVKIDFDSKNPWENERFQRNSIQIGLSKIELSDDDLIIISDLDEVPDIHTIKSLEKIDLEKGRSLIQDIYYYNLNTKIDTMHTAVIVPYKVIENYGGPQIVRDNFRNFEPLPKGGWHFSFFGDVEFIINKVKNYSHQEFNSDEFLNIDHIQNCISNQKDIFRRSKENGVMNFIKLEDNNYLPKNYDLLINEEIVFNNDQNKLKHQYIYCTIAIGEKYYKSAIQFAKKLNEISVHHKVLIITDQQIDSIENCEIINVPNELTLFYPNGCFNYNLKYYPIKLASMRKVDFVIYFDADWIIAPDYNENKVFNFLNWFGNSDFDFCFERPHFISGKKDWNTCFWRHKIEPYKLMETDKYDLGHVCNEQFLAFKNNKKLVNFVDAWDKRDKFSVDNNIWPFAEGLEIGMSSIDADMNFTWGGFHFLNSCFRFYCITCDEPLTRF